MLDMMKEGRQADAKQLGRVMKSLVIPSCNAMIRELYTCCRDMNNCAPLYRAEMDALNEEMMELTGRNSDDYLIE